jgi:hypothetical protein
MNTIKEKRIYFPPLVEHVNLDKEISLALESPPAGPDELSSLAPEYFNNNPLKITIC